MMRSTFIMIVLFLGWYGITYAQIPSKTDCSDYNSISKTIDLTNFSFIEGNLDTSFGVVVFLGTDCPISQKYMHTLRSLCSDYSKDITLFGIIPHHFSEEKIASFKKEYKAPFILVRDRGNEFAKTFGATVTPEVFLFNPDGEILYDGAIDNWYFSLGRNRLKPSEHYLIDAIESAKIGALIGVPHTDAVGCFIEFKK